MLRGGVEGGKERLAGRGAALQDLAEGFHTDVDETSISAGFQHTCGIQDIGKDFGGKVVCWGADDHGQVHYAICEMPAPVWSVNKITITKRYGRGLEIAIISHLKP